MHYGKYTQKYKFEDILADIYISRKIHMQEYTLELYTYIEIATYIWMFIKSVETD